MNNTLGEKIKNIRKEKRITQSDLVGKSMSKSMLSLIENNQATPSLKTLTYISSKLDVPLSYFLDNGVTGNSTLSHQQVLKLKESFAEFNEFYKNNLLDKAKRKMNYILSNFVLTKSNVICADIQMTFGKFLYDIDKFDEAEQYLNESKKIYMYNDLYVNAAESHLMLYTKYYNKYDMNKCTEILNESFRIYSKSTVNNYIFEIDLLDKKISHGNLINNSYETINVLVEEALNLSKKSNMYKYEELYRAKALTAAIHNKYTVFVESIKKSLELCKLMNPNNIKLINNIYLSMGIGYNLIGKFKDALYYLNLIESNFDNLNRIVSRFSILIEKVKCYYNLNDLEKAQKFINLIDLDFYKTNLSFAPEKVYYYNELVKLAKIINELGDYSQAVKITKEAIEYISNFSLDHNLYFAYKTLGEIHESQKKYEESFFSVKKANKFLEKAFYNKQKLIL